MSTLKTVGLVAALILAPVFLFGVFPYINANNAGARMEAGIDASYKDNRNILAQYGLKVREAAGVTDVYTQDLEKVVTAAIEGRYGDTGSKAVFQWIQEQNPTVDSSLYLKVQQIIEAGRNQFQNGQTSLLDKCRIYQASRNYFWSGFWLRVAGYPKDQNLEKKCTPVSSELADKAFESGRDEVIKLR